MTGEEKQKAIDALKISAPVKAVTQEEFNNYIQTLNKIMDWLEQEPTIQERQAESDKFDATFQDGYNNGYAQAKFDYDQKPVLDKIRAEIANHLQIMDICDVKIVNGVIVQSESVNKKVVLYDSVMQIINKYKEESEEV